MDSANPFLDTDPEALLIPAKKFPLCALPRELQLRILRFSVVDTQPVDDVTFLCRSKYGYGSDWIHKWKPSSPYINTNTLFASKWLYVEGLKMLYGENRFRFRARWNRHKHDLDEIFKWFGHPVTWFDNEFRGLNIEENTVENWEETAMRLMARKDLVRHIIVRNYMPDDEEDTASGITRIPIEPPTEELLDGIPQERIRRMLPAAWQCTFIRILRWFGVKLDSLSIIFEACNDDHLKLLEFENRFLKFAWITGGYDDFIEERPARREGWQSDEILEGFMTADPFPLDPRWYGYVIWPLTACWKVKNVNIRGIKAESTIGKECLTFLQGVTDKNTEIKLRGELKYVPLPDIPFRKPFCWLDASSIASEATVVLQAMERTRMKAQLEETLSTAMNTIDFPPVVKATCLLELPDSILGSIMSHVLVAATPIENPFLSQGQKSTSSLCTCVLRTCEKLYGIGIQTLYGENKFRFMPTSGSYQVTKEEVLTFVTKPLANFDAREHSLNRAQLLRNLMLSNELNPSFNHKITKSWYWQVSVLRAIWHTGLQLDFLSLDFSPNYTISNESLIPYDEEISEMLSRFMYRYKGKDNTSDHRLLRCPKIETLLLYRPFGKDVHCPASHWQEEMSIDSEDINDRLAEFVLRDARENCNVIFGATAYY